ncbi:MAG: bifunctional 5,10-methylenetetrahydrofolate dehydrogenase/5,10-methenyltetrahydrofolate cyclohydrolase [Candidatus Paracaedibacteraceae bacterium]|nr:bifunctional 5,10-methylenetetrahydrofolate dehydrogenase/5,10-methenyltetrahydrofolate cyclohydrolase [Candidatus Paracaedibacteraceae bacterium]
MTAILINGHAISTTVRKEVETSAVKFLHTYKIKPGLAIVIVGDNPSSQAYVNIKLKRCAEIGIHAELVQFETDEKLDVIIKVIDNLNCRKDIHGIIIQLPLPGNLNANTLIDRISPEKDVDGLHLANIGALHSNRAGIIPCTPKGILTLLKTLPVSLSGKSAVVIGRSLIVGKPMAALLLQENCTVTHIHSYSENWEKFTKEADIIVIAAGIPKLLHAHHIKEGAVVIDVGSTRIINDTGSSVFVGDIDSGVFQKAGYITPVPGGVGPMTVAHLLQNTVEAAWKQQNV